MSTIRSFSAEESALIQCTLVPLIDDTTIEKFDKRCQKQMIISQNMIAFETISKPNGTQVIRKVTQTIVDTQSFSLILFRTPQGCTKPTRLRELPTAKKIQNQTKNDQNGNESCKQNVHTQIEIQENQQKQQKINQNEQKNQNNQKNQKNQKCQENEIKDAEQPTSSSNIQTNELSREQNPNNMRGRFNNQFGFNIIVPQHPFFENLYYSPEQLSHFAKNFILVNRFYERLSNDAIVYEKYMNFESIPFFKNGIIWTRIDFVLNHKLRAFDNNPLYKELNEFIVRLLDQCVSSHIKTSHLFSYLRDSGPELQIITIGQLVYVNILICTTLFSLDATQHFSKKVYSRNILLFYYWIYGFVICVYSYAIRETVYKKYRNNVSNIPKQFNLERTDAEIEKIGTIHPSDCLVALQDWLSPRRTGRDRCDSCFLSKILKFSYQPMYPSFDNDQFYPNQQEGKTDYIYKSLIIPNEYFKTYEPILTKQVRIYTETKKGNVEETIQSRNNSAQNSISTLRIDRDQMHYMVIYIHYDEITPSENTSLRRRYFDSLYKSDQNAADIQFGVLGTFTDHTLLTIDNYSFKGIITKFSKNQYRTVTLAQILNIATVAIHIARNISIHHNPSRYDIQCEQITRTLSRKDEILDFLNGIIFLSKNLNSCELGVFERMKTFIRNIKYIYQHSGTSIPPAIKSRIDKYYIENESYDNEIIKSLHETS